MRIGNTIQDLVQALLNEMRSAFAGFIEDNFSSLRDPAEGLAEEIKIMLGRGEISQEQYEQLNRKLKYNSLGRGDLELLRRQARNRAYKRVGEGPSFREPGVADGLDRLYIRIASLEDARREAEHAVKSLEADLKRIREYASSAEEIARRTLPDESEARAVLEIRQNMLERIQVLEAHKRSLEQAIRRLEVLQGELYAREAELRALGAQAGLARNEYMVWEGMLNQNEMGPQELQANRESDA